MSPKLMTRRQAASLIGVSVSTVIRLQHEGRLTVVRLRPGGVVHYRVEQVEALLTEAADA